MKAIKGLIGLIVVTVTLVAVYLLFFSPSEEVKRAETRNEKKDKTETPESGAVPQERVKAKISIIIDDIGFNLRPLTELLKIDAPIAFAILPYCPHSVDAAEMVHGAKREILLHLPMEAQDSKNNPGPGALFRWMQEAEIRQQLIKDLDNVPYVLGVNNHMGSAFMEDEAKLHIVLQTLKERGLYFIDSRTTPDSRADKLAKRTEIRYASRKLFLDNNQDEEIIVNNLLGYCEKHDTGTAVIIGHPYRQTVKALAKAVPILKSMGVNIVPPTEIVKVIGEAKIINREE